jgi:hypothetical protein
VFAADGGFAVIDRLSREESELRVLMGALRPEFDQHSGELLGFRVSGCDTAVDQDIDPMFTPAAISFAEMQRNAEGHSRTYGLREEERLARVRSGEAPEDDVERTWAKVRVYPVIGAAKGDILRVWPR